MSLPKIAYILLWFPKPSETFIFREVANLKKMDLPLKVYTHYGKLKKLLSPEMESFQGEVVRFGIPLVKRLPQDLLYWWRRNASVVSRLFKTVPFRRWKTAELAGENLWGFLCGFTFARLFEEDGIDHIHAPWANGPATSAWIASRLTGIPFSFVGRASDIFPPDGALREKIRESQFVRINSKVSMDHMAAHADGHTHKIHLTYNGYPLAKYREAPAPMKPPYRILALGRFAGCKGFDVLLRAARIMADQGIDFKLTIAGNGVRGILLKGLCKGLGLDGRVSFPGYITYDRVSDLFCRTDVFVMPCTIHRSGQRDGIPNVLVEALLHRLPVVATDVGGIGEVILDGETGRLVNQRDARTLARAIVKMTEDRAKALEMAEKGRARVLDMFDPEKRHRKVLELFEQFHSSGGRIR